MDDDADERATTISQQMPIALIDRRILEGLQRLGVVSPAKGAQISMRPRSSLPRSSPH